MSQEITIADLRRIQGDFESMFFVRRKRLRQSLRQRERNAVAAQTKEEKLAERRRRRKQGRALRNGFDGSALAGAPGTPERIEALERFYAETGATLETPFDREEIIPSSAFPSYRSGAELAE